MAEAQGHKWRAGLARYSSGKTFTLGVSVGRQEGIRSTRDAVSA